MKSIKLMLLGLVLILLGMSLGLIPNPILPLTYTWLTQVGPSSYQGHSTSYANIVAYILILIGIAIALIGYFRKEKV